MLNLYFKSLLILVTAFSSINFLFASEDWAYDLRYQEFLTQADQGDGAAMYELGVMTERGQGTDRNIDKAIVWFEKAIKQKNNSAYVRLGKIYLEGISVKKDYKKAHNYLLKAEKAKSSGAYYYLGVIYENAYGVKRNLSRAKSNYEKAERNGHFGAKHKVKKITLLIKQKNKKNKNLIEGQPPVESVRKNQTEIDVSTEIKKKSAKKSTNKQFVTIKDIKKSLLTGMWFNGKRPLGFLPSPQTYCISKNKVGLRCVSKEMHRNTGREKIYYLIESKISDIGNYGDFTITYKNKVTKVDVLNIPTESGEQYVSRIKIGVQRKEHVLKCNVSGKSVSCNKDGSNNYVFVNLTKPKKSSRIFYSAFE